MISLVSKDYPYTRVMQDISWEILGVRSGLQSTSYLWVNVAAASTIAPSASVDRAKGKWVTTGTVQHLKLLLFLFI